ncbi:adenylate/guanylate cyclase domain-containing protein [Leptospira sp. WS92.C1]
MKDKKKNKSDLNNENRIKNVADKIVDQIRHPATLFSNQVSAPVANWDKMFTDSILSDAAMKTMEEVSKINSLHNYQMALKLPPVKPIYLYDQIEETKPEQNLTSNEELEHRNIHLLEELKKAEISNAEKDKIIQELEYNYNKITAHNEVIHISSRIHDAAGDMLLEDKGFRKEYFGKNNFDAVVFSLDIRRSTDLMLDARTPEMYSKFISKLTNTLKQCVLENYGVFDKFTGDGILAFFSKKYTGEQAILYALRASIEAHRIFRDLILENRNSFNILLDEIGLGIGIDFGSVYGYETNSDFSIVGSPVVYACRFSGTLAGSTLLNIGAIEELKQIIPEDCLSLTETKLPIKNKGTATGYFVNLDWNRIELNHPAWLKNE